MALLATGLYLGSRACLLLLLSLGWVQPLRAAAVETRQDVMSTWLRRTDQDPSRQLTAALPRPRRGTEKRPCPPGRKALEVDENLVFYEEWDLEACVDGALLAAQMERVNQIPFTHQQLSVFKRKLDEVYPQGYPESLIQRLGYFFFQISPEDIHKWNVTSLGTVKALLRVSQGRRVDAQVAALVTRYLGGGGQLDMDTLQALSAFPPASLCLLSPGQLGPVQPSVLWAARPQDLDTCGPRQLATLYPKAHLAFQNLSRSEYLVKIQPFLGGAASEDLRALSLQNVTLTLATFKKLRTDAVLPLTVAEVQRLLGPQVVGLKAAAQDSPVREWIFHQPQGDLDTLGLGLRGGVPNGYLVLDLSFREALSGVPRLLQPGPTAIVTLVVLWAHPLS
ncbi:mesothelin [Tupaia chinensis]|uniref:mesothelin n=1 Tax=Tupaia chinensis TaxID=246437 RepID=UPI0003C90663|nr:mesothelin [Tupaia chinensis]